MSLTRQVKQELARSEDRLNCCGSWELKALLLRHGYFTIRRGTRLLSASVDDIAVARRLFYLLRQAGVVVPAIIKEQDRRFRKNRYVVQVQGSEQVDALLIYLNLKEAGPFFSLPRRHVSLPRRLCCKKAFLRGAFLAGGSLSVSRKSGYHLEVSCSGIEDAQAYQKVLKSFNLAPLLRKRDDAVFLYFKSAESVADFLRIVGAGGALLELESQRVVKSMRNQVNRLVNCETANLEKTVASAQQQLETIDALDRLVGLHSLSPALQEAAQIRREHPEASLKELGELLDPPVTKSGMNHRFRQLEKILHKNRPGI